MSLIKILNFIGCSGHAIMAIINEMTPWQAITRLPDIIAQLLAGLNLNEYQVNNNQAVHLSSVVEPNDHWPRLFCREWGFIAWLYYS